MQFLGLKIISLSESKFQSKKILLRGHSTTTWTKFYQILPNFDTLLFALEWTFGQLWTSTLCHVIHCGRSTDTLAPLLVYVVIECPLSETKFQSNNLFLSSKNEFSKSPIHESAAKGLKCFLK